MEFKTSDIRTTDEDEKSRNFKNIKPKKSGVE